MNTGLWEGPREEQAWADKAHGAEGLEELHWREAVFSLEKPVEQLWSGETSAPMGWGRDGPGKGW